MADFWTDRSRQNRHVVAPAGEIVRESTAARRNRRPIYATTVAPGVTIAGAGESLGDRDRENGTRWWTLPFLLLGSTRRVLFPTRGKQVPFTISNDDYVDRFGRETVTWARRFNFPRRTRAFDATMIYSEQRDTIVDYLGTHQHLAVDQRDPTDLKNANGPNPREGSDRFRCLATSLCR